MTKQRDLALEWLVFAGEDLQAAHVLSKEGIYSQACFHAQQFAEKLFKAFLHFHAISFKKIHDLNELFRICLPVNEEILQVFEEPLMVLNLYYAPTRYPDGIPGSFPHRLPNKTDAAQAFATAEKLYKTISLFLEK